MKLQDRPVLDILSETETLGTASVWTGTLLGTSDGDLIQAHASFNVKGAAGTAALTYSLNSLFAKTTVVLEATASNEILLMPADLKCSLVN